MGRFKDGGSGVVTHCPQMKRAPPRSREAPATWQTAISANDNFFMRQLQDHEDEDDEDRNPDEDPLPLSVPAAARSVREANRCRSCALIVRTLALPLQATRRSRPNSGRRSCSRGTTGPSPGPPIGSPPPRGDHSRLGDPRQRSQHAHRVRANTDRAV